MSLAEFLGEEERKSGLMIVDFSQIIISTINATFRPTEELSVDLIRHVALNSIRFNVLTNKAIYPDIVLACDRGPYWRKEIAEYYKAHRKDQRDNSGWDWKVIFEAMNQVREELHLIFPYRTIQIAGIEADDIAGVLTHQLWHKYDRILLVSSDSDWAQLSKFKNVKQWSPIQKKWVEPKHGSAHLHLMEKIIKGDPKDCIASIKSVADHLMNFRDTRQKSIYQKELDIWMHEPVENWGDEFTIKRFHENQKMLDLGMIPQEIQDKIMAAFDEPRPNGAGIFNYFIKHRLKEMLGRIGEFV